MCVKQGDLSGTRTVFRWPVRDRRADPAGVRAAGVDHQTVEDFEKELSGNLDGLQKQRREGNYRPQAIRRKWIPKPGSSEKRPLGIPTVRDRVVQAAVVMVLEPIFE
jgi:RNA-directed DNA polymerase